MNEPILKIENLRKTFGEKVAVDDLSFKMTSPGVFGLIGTNGAGKTTTIRMILGILRPDSGCATWDGHAISRESLPFGYMPEERGIYTKSKVLDQLIYFGMLRGMSKKNAESSASSLMERLGVSEYKDMLAEKLSKGNQQKIQLIATLIHNPKLIFLDEPFSGLDPVNAELLSNLIKELVAEGKYIVMSSHQMPLVEEYCENLVILNNGKAVLSGNLSEIKAGYGHTNLVVSAISEILPVAKQCGLVLKKADASNYHFGITGDEMAKSFLSCLVSAGIHPLKYSVTEPSLSEIFIEKVEAAGKEADNI